MHPSYEGYQTGVGAMTQYRLCDDSNVFCYTIYTTVHTFVRVRLSGTASSHNLSQ